MRKFEPSKHALKATHSLLFLFLKKLFFLLFFGLFLAVSSLSAQEGSSLSVMMQTKQDSLKILEDRLAARRNGKKPKTALSDSIPKDSIVVDPWRSFKSDTVKVIHYGNTSQH